METPSEARPNRERYGGPSCFRVGRLSLPATAGLDRCSSNDRTRLIVLLIILIRQSFWAVFLSNEMRGKKIGYFTGTMGTGDAAH